MNKKVRELASHGKKTENWTSFPLSDMLVYATHDPEGKIFKIPP